MKPATTGLTFRELGDDRAYGGPGGDVMVDGPGNDCPYRQGGRDGVVGGGSDTVSGGRRRIDA